MRAVDSFWRIAAAFLSRPDVTVFTLAQKCKDFLAQKCKNFVRRVVRPPKERDCHVRTLALRGMARCTSRMALYPQKRTLTDTSAPVFAHPLA